MGTSWIRPTVTTRHIAGGYILVRSFAVLALWQGYRDGHITLMDVRTAFAAVESVHRTATRQRVCAPGRAVHCSDATPHADLSYAAWLTRSSCVRKTRACLKRLANAGLPPEQLLGRAGEDLAVMVRDTTDLADRPVVVPRRMLRFFAREGTAAGIAVGFAHLLRGSFFRAGTVRLGGTCSAAWVARVFALDERTAKKGRCGLVECGWLVPAASPVWHRQRYGATFVINAAWNTAETPTASRSALAVPGLPPRVDGDAPGSPPPRKNKDLPLRGFGNQDRAVGPGTHRAEPLGGQSSSVCPRHPRPSVLSISEADLDDPHRTLALLQDAQRRGLIGQTDAERLRFFTTVRHARSKGNRPCALLAALAWRRCWHYGTQADEDDARRMLRRLEEGPQRTAVAPTIEPSPSHHRDDFFVHISDPAVQPPGVIAALVARSLGVPVRAVGA